MTLKAKLATAFTILVILPALGWLGTWITVLAANEPINHRFAAYPIWPVACSTRGCVTSSSWLKQHQLNLIFFNSTNQTVPTAEQALTTTIRHHIVANAFLRSPVTAADAQRYREEILNLKKQDQVKDILDVPLGDYDNQVILPLLQQEALRQQHKVESTQELYKQLGEERFIILLPFHLRWDKDKQEAVSRN